MTPKQKEKVSAERSGKRTGRDSGKTKNRKGRTND